MPVKIKHNNTRPTYPRKPVRRLMRINKKLLALLNRDVADPSRVITFDAINSLLPELNSAYLDAGIIA